MTINLQTSHVSLICGEYQNSGSKTSTEAIASHGTRTSTHITSSTARHEVACEAPHNIASYMARAVPRARRGSRSYFFGVGRGITHVAAATFGSTRAPLTTTTLYELHRSITGGNYIDDVTATISLQEGLKVIKKQQLAVAIYISVVAVIPQGDSKRYTLFQTMLAEAVCCY